MNIPTINGTFLLTRVAVLYQRWRKSARAMLEFRCVFKLDDVVFAGERMMVVLDECDEHVREFARDHMIWTYPIIAIEDPPKFCCQWIPEPWNSNDELEQLVRCSS